MLQSSARQDTVTVSLCAMRCCTLWVSKGVCRKALPPPPSALPRTCLFARARTLRDAVVQCSTRPSCTRPAWTADH